MTQPQWIRRVFKPVVFLACLIPLAFLVTDALTGNLSANPIDDFTDTTGTWTLRFLMITMAITPLRKISGWNWLLRFRRMIGLFAFFYVCLHFTTYIYLDQFFDWTEIIADVQKRPFITVGFASFLMLIPLAATSTDRITKWMGAKRWNLLHKLVYLIAAGGVVHYLWLVKADTRRPLTYGAILALLLGYRAWIYFAQRVRQRHPIAEKIEAPT